MTISKPETTTAEYSKAIIMSVKNLINKLRDKECYIYDEIEKCSGIVRSSESELQREYQTKRKNGLQYAHDHVLECINIVIDSMEEIIRTIKKDDSEENREICEIIVQSGYGDWMYKE